MEKTKKILIVIFLIFIYLFRIWQTTGCRQFRGFYFNPLSIKINVESQIGTDININRNVSRFFHNKISAGIHEIVKSYALTLEPRLLLEILGPVGISLVAISIFCVFKNKAMLKFTHLLIVLATSFILILPVPPKTPFYLNAVAWYSFSFWGIGFFLKKGIFQILFITLLMMTFWYFSFSWQIPAICNEIFFN